MNPVSVRLGLIVGVVAIVGLLAGAGAEVARSAAAEPPVTLPDPAEKAQLREWIRGFAAFNGESAPADGRVIATTRARFNRADSGAEVETDPPVWVVVVRGDFVANAAHPPYGAELPRGRFMVVAVDAQTKEVTDWGVGNRPFPVAEFAEVEPLDS
jgi:hypothetical protein